MAISNRLLAVLMLCLVSTGIAAHEYSLGELKIDHPWTRATPGGATTAAGYARITNTGGQADRLLGGSFTRAERVEVHEMSMQDNVMRMRRLADGLEILPGETVELKPGSFHLMMIGLSEPVSQGERIRGTLIFERAGTVDVEFTVDETGADKPGHNGHMHAH